MKIINPATEELIKEVEEDDHTSLIAKFQLLKQAQYEWAQVSLIERIKILNNFSNLLEKNIEFLSALLSSEMGKPLQQSRNEINGGRTRIKWLTANAEKYLSEEWMVQEGNIKEKIVYEPLG
ncbi:MAG TPA: aldehyde dehydrogenase family protein, partial [Flavisolibacter sp.]|nr:aldehyde dehydrogenase family protein [Flavisolibacter sp.]